MNSRDYWAMRSAQDMVDRMGTAEQTAAEMNKAIQQSADYIAREVKAVFRGIESFGISESEARKILNAAGNKTALQNLRAAAQRVSDPEKRQALMSAIDSAGAYRYRITRLEQLNKDINAECRKLYQTENRAVTSALKTVANDSYYHSIFNIQQETGLGFSFAKFSQKDVDRILRANWLGGNYSQRIWRDVSATAESMKKELLVSMLSGRSNEKTARIIQERFGVNAYCARRIVRTESAYVANAAQMSAYDEAGVEKYRFIATLDSKTSEVCAALDGKVFPAKDAVPGTNYPPMHPFCRSTTIAEFGGDTLAGMERRARDKDGNVVKVPADMGYEEWYKQNVSEKEQLPLDNSAGSGIIDVVEKTVGAKRQAPISVESAVAGANPYYSQGTEYRINCQRCVQTYELRRRGYDVIAKPKPSANNRVVWGSECFIPPDKCQESWEAFTLNLSQADVKKELNSAPDGARYAIYTKWKGRGNGAHVFIAEKVNGEVLYLDPQSGKQNVDYYFRKGSPNRFGFFRMDDKDILAEPDIIEATVEVKKHDR